MLFYLLKLAIMLPLIGLLGWGALKLAHKSLHLFRIEHLPGFYGG